MTSVMDPGNRTVIGSVVFVDIVDYSKQSVTKQIAMKDRFNSLLFDSLKSIPPDQRIILDTGDGAAVSFLGDPEDALYVAMNLRNRLRPESTAGEPSTADQTSASIAVRIGINLGPMRLTRDINGHPNIVGDGINVAERIMGFAAPGQVAVSRSYYDVASVVCEEYAELFKFEGSRTDKHVREHEIYVLGESDAAFNKAKSSMEDRTPAPNQAIPASTATGPRKNSVLLWSAVGLLLVALASWFGLQGSEKPKSDQPPTPVVSPVATPPAARPSEVQAKAPGPKASAPVAVGAAVSASSAVSAPANADIPKAMAVQGTLTFAIQPWGDVLVNGKSVGVSPPLKQYKLTPGMYKIEVQNTTFPPFVVNVEVKSREDISIRHQFK